MCPACLTTVALIAAGASSTGGLGAFVMRILRGKGGANNGDQRSEPEIARGSTTAPYPSAGGSLPASGN